MISAAVYAHRVVLYATAVTVLVACVAAMPLLGWPVGLGAVAGAVLALVTFAAQLRAERREHERDIRELRAGAVS